MIRFLTAALFAAALSFVGAAQPPKPADAPAFARGGKPSPRNRIAAAHRFQVFAAPPAQFAMVPLKVSVWGNNQYGDCVTAEEAAADAAWSAYCGVSPPTFIPDAEVVRWARAHGVLEGATLVEVLDAMQRDGFRGADGKPVLNGGYSAVDYENVLALKSALTVGPVKIAIDADALPRGAGNQQGWYATGKGRFPNTDHCVGLMGYGPAKWLCEQLKVPLPSGLAADKEMYLLFTWGTIGLVDHDWLLGTCVEAWVRNPTTPGQVPPVNPPAPPNPPTPPPTPPNPPPPTPPGSGFTGTLTYVNGVLVSVGPTPQPSTDLSAEALAAAFRTGKADPATVLADLIALYAAYQTKDPVAIAAAVAKLIADLKGPKENAAVTPDIPSLVALCACLTTGDCACGPGCKCGADGSGLKVVRRPVWQSDYDKAVRSAAKDATFVVLFTDPKNCAPCRRLEAGALSDPAVRDVLADCVCIKVDVGTDAGRSLLARYAAHGDPVAGWPTVKVYRGGARVADHVGEMSVDVLLKLVR